LRISTDSDHSTEHDFHSEERDESDTESGGGGGNSRGNSKRYSDRERTKTPDNVVTSAPTFKLDDRKSINVKNTIKPVGTSSTATKSTKKIDLGAASNYGKPADFGINSPTHRNSHNEDLFSNDDEDIKKPTKSTKTAIEDIFGSEETSNIIDNDDDFNPRADEKDGGEFGDFESAFPSAGNVQSTSIKPAAPSSEFADFTAFSGTPAAPTQSSSDIDNFLFSSPPPTVATSATIPKPQSTTPISSTNFLDSGSDLFGNNVITSAFTSPPTSLIGSSSNNSKDLLSDFDNLTLNPIQGKHKAKHLYFTFFHRQGFDGENDFCGYF
jgi:hypothetical protein